MNTTKGKPQNVTKLRQENTLLNNFPPKIHYQTTFHQKYTSKDKVRSQKYSTDGNQQILQLVAFP